MILKYKIQDLDLSIFKKHSFHYLSSMKKLGLEKIEFHVVLDTFEIFIKALGAPDECWIYIEDKGTTIKPLSDPRFCNFKVIREIFKGPTALTIFSNKDPKTFTDQFCKY